MYVYITTPHISLYSVHHHTVCSTALTAATPIYWKQQAPVCHYVKPVPKMQPGLAGWLAGWLANQVAGCTRMLTRLLLMQACPEVQTHPSLKPHTLGVCPLMRSAR